MTVDRYAAGVSVGCAPLVWFANTLPVLQWIATLVAIVSGSIVIFRMIKEKKNGIPK